MIRPSLIAHYQEAKAEIITINRTHPQRIRLAALLDDIVILAGDVLRLEYIEKYPAKHCRTPTSRGPECQHDWYDSDWQAEARRILEQ